MAFLQCLPIVGAKGHNKGVMLCSLFHPSFRIVTGCLVLQGYLAQEKCPPPLGPYSRPMPRTLWWSYGGMRFLVSQSPL